MAIDSRGKFSFVLWLALFLLAAGVGPALAARRPHGARHAATAAGEPGVALEQVHVFGDRPAPFVLDATAACLVDARSGTQLYAYNEHEKIEPASLAKIMTFYLVLQALRDRRLTVDTEVPVSEAAWRLSMDQSVSRMFLGVGQKVAVHDLLDGLMVSSGNDAAVTLAEYLAGSTDAFTKDMNDQAAKLGLNETHFDNPDGLPVPGEYTTASDMVKLARALTTRFPEAFTYTSTKEFTFDNIRQRNFNTLLFYDSRVNGLKTGHVQEAGFHLVATSNSNGLELISAVMGTPSMEKRRTETEKLIDWAFHTFASVSPDWRRAVSDSLPVYEGTADSVAVAPDRVPYATVFQGDEGKVVLTGGFDSRYLVAPVAAGTQVGEMTLSVNGTAQSAIPIRTQAPVPEAGIWKRFKDSIRMRF
ncbi:MAG TPA: D-alanyl-D-alanine carboxypeptidase family protein [Candidatus Binataceae bacterium]|nr:D-alanyl-D-alanine carboxypeptidase family protein [Candidatus Binataceae bacterium]